MFIFALRRLNDFLRSNNPRCSTKGKQTGLRNNTYSVQNSFCYYFVFELFSPFCEIRHKLNKQNLQRQNLESLYAKHFLAKINCNKCNYNIRSLILILIRNSMKRQTEKKGKQAFRDEKNYSEQRLLSWESKVLRVQSRFTLTPFVPNFCKFFKHFKKAIVNVDSL